MTGLNLTPTHDYPVYADSGGCVSGSMEWKRKERFCPPDEVTTEGFR